MKKMLILLMTAGLCALTVLAQRTQKPVLHAQNWLAITGKPLGASAGAAIFHQGGNAVDAACAMLGATSTMWDALSWGGETQALIYNPHTGEVIGVNALGVAPTGATPQFYTDKGMEFPPDLGPLAAVTPGTPGGLMTMLAEFGTMSLKEVLEPSIQMAAGYPIEAGAANHLESQKEQLRQWPYSKEIFLVHDGDREAPEPGEILVQQDLLNTLNKLVEAEAQALEAGKTRKEAIYAAYDRFYKGDIAEEFARGCQEMGGLITKEDLANWKVYLEKPVKTSYKGLDVYKLTHWVQGPVMLQALNMLEQLDVESMGYNSAAYIHAVYQVMNLAYADRDFYYGDPYFPPEEPIEGLLSKEYAKARLEQINWEKNDTLVRPGDPYPYQGEQKNPYLHYISDWSNKVSEVSPAVHEDPLLTDNFFAGTTSIQAADKEGWVVSVTPSGGWIPAAVAGKTGIGMSQRMQSFVLDPSQNPFNVLEPGKRPRATLTPSMVLKDGKPHISFAIQGGDAQDQNSIQFFLNMVEFGMNVQQAAEAANFLSYQMRNSFGGHEIKPGFMTLNQEIPPWVRNELEVMSYKLDYRERTSGPMNAIYFDREHGTMWGGSSNDGEDYGIGW
jgi:gamma-glutamyltranspeptidase/glutathione hydrolase